MHTATTGESWRKSTVVAPWAAWTSAPFHGLSNLPSAPASNVTLTNSAWLPGRDPSCHTSSQATSSAVPIGMPPKPSATVVRTVRTPRSGFGLKRLRFAPDVFRRSYRASQARRLRFAKPTNIRPSLWQSTPERRALPWAAPKKHSIAVQVQEALRSTCDAQTQVNATSSSQQELDRLHRENYSLRAECDSLSHSYRIMRDEATQLHETKQILAFSPGALKIKVAELHAACTTKDAEITATSEELRILKEQNAELEEQVKHQKAALAFSSEQLNLLKGDRDSLTEHASKLNEEIRSLRQNVVELRDELQKQNDAVDKRTKLVADLEATVDGLRAKNAAMETDMTKFKHETEDKCAQLRATFDARKQALAEKIQQLEAVREAQAQQIKSLAEEREEHKKEIAGLRQETATIDKEKKALEKQVLLEKSSKEAGLKQIESMSKEREDHKKEIARLREELTDTFNKEKRAIEDELLQRKSRNEADVKQIESLSKQREDYKKEMARLRGENEALRKEARLKNSNAVSPAENIEERTRPMTRNARKRQALAAVNEGSPRRASDGSTATAKRTRPPTRSTASASKESEECSGCAAKDAQLSKHIQLLEKAQTRLKARKQDEGSPAEQQYQNEAVSAPGFSRCLFDREAVKGQHGELAPPRVTHLGQLLRDFEPEVVARNASLRGTAEEELVLPLELIYTGSVQRLTVTGNDGKAAELEIDVMPGSPEGCRYTFSHYSYPHVLDRDLVFTLKYEQHPTLRREGIDLVHKHNVSLRQALLGAKISVELFTGEVVMLEFDRPIQHGEKHRVEGRGLPILNDPSGDVKRGDLIVEFDVVFPDTLSRMAREQINQALTE